MGSKKLLGLGSDLTVLGKKLTSLETVLHETNRLLSALIKQMQEEQKDRTRHHKEIIRGLTDESSKTSSTK